LRPNRTDSSAHAENRPRSIRRVWAAIDFIIIINHKQKPTLQNRFPSVKIARAFFHRRCPRSRKNKPTLSIVFLKSSLSIAQLCKL
jgi:hypothetical protein